MDEFSEKLRTAFDRPPSPLFWEQMLLIFWENVYIYVFSSFILDIGQIKEIWSELFLGLKWLPPPLRSFPENSYILAIRGTPYLWNGLRSCRYERACAGGPEYQMQAEEVGRCSSQHLTRILLRSFPFWTRYRWSAPRSCCRWSRCGESASWLSLAPLQSVSKPPPSLRTNSHAASGRSPRLCPEQRCTWIWINMCILIQKI